VDTAVNQFVPLAGSFGGWEIILILCVVLILLGAKNLPRLSAGLGSGLLDEFKKATDEVADEMRGDEKTSGLLYEAITANNRTAEFVYPEPESPNAVRGLILFLAQGFGVGRIPFAPGTLGSIVGVGWFALLLGTGNFWFYLAGTLAGVAVAVWLCGRRKDPETNRPALRSPGRDRRGADLFSALGHTSLAWGRHAAGAGDLFQRAGFVAGGSDRGALSSV